MTLPLLTPKQAADKCRQNAVLIDIRSADEYRQQHIPNARSVPLADLAAAEKQPEQMVLIFYCSGGMRTQSNAAVLAQYAQCCEAYILDGGLSNWNKAGLPVVGTHRDRIDMVRQTQIVAGSLILLGALLGVLISPWFFVLCAFVGAGLLFAGLTGFCGMAKLLAKMPWNQAV